MKKSDIGLIGLAVMGENLVMNIESKGYMVSVYNRTLTKVTDFINGRARDKKIIPAYSLAELVGQLEKPRKVIMMVKAGPAVDEMIECLITLLEPNDIIIDGGNSHFLDTVRRMNYVEGYGLLYIGTGISGGEEGALKGPSIMPGGSEKAWPYLKPIFQAIAAKVADGSPCCEWVGSGGAGHYVKMVHNGIEYGDMQLICESYQLMRDGLGLNADEMQETFKQWNSGDLNSYLIEITGDILAFRDDDGQPLVDKILDTAGQKGTGKWTVNSSLDEGIALTLIGAAVFARYLSAIKSERTAAAQVLSGSAATMTVKKEVFIELIRQALFAAKIVSYAQGYALMKAAAQTYGWKLNYGEIALMWRGGCIIRSAFLGEIKKAFDRKPDLDNLLLDDYFRNKMAAAQNSWRKVCAEAMLCGIPIPAMAGALSFYDSYRCERLPANLLQAQRDYFGAHTYERVDRPSGVTFHTNWTGTGGMTSSSSYNA